jgi:hypothetical protein
MGTVLGFPWQCSSSVEAHLDYEKLFSLHREMTYVREIPTQQNCPDDLKKIRTMGYVGIFTVRNNETSMNAAAPYKETRIFSEFCFRRLK